MADKCPKCGKRMMLVDGLAADWIPDDEPFESGVEEEVSEPPRSVHVLASICEGCGHVGWIAPQDERPRIAVLEAENAKMWTIVTAARWARQNHRNAVFPALLEGLWNAVDQYDPPKEVRDA